MDTAVVKIESAYISLARVNKSGDEYCVTALNRIDLPESVAGEEAAGNPDLVAALIISALHEWEAPVKNLSVYLGGGTELFAEYRYSDTLPEPAIKQRSQQTEEALLAGAAAPLYRVKHYTYDGTDSGLSASAALAADTAFCDRLRSVLAKGGFSVGIISSSLTAFAEIAKSLSFLGDRLIVLCAEKREMQTALVINGRLARLARIAKGTDARDPAAPLLPFITAETTVVLCGGEAEDPVLLSRLRQAGASDAFPLDPDTAKEAGRVKVSEENDFKGLSFPAIFASAAFFGEEGDSAYFSEERDVKKVGAALRVACIVALVVAVFACLLPVATLTAAEREMKESLRRLETPFFADAAAKLAEYRLLVSEHSELFEAEGAVPARDPSHANLLEETVTGLLSGTIITEMYYEKGKGILADFTTRDAAAFDARKEKAESNRDILLYEAKPREEIGEGEWHIQIRVTLAPSAPEAP